ncbi:MAG TPA: hypothetical protein VMI92_00085 [Steroidobacteraceae bacterium]|nr:hypothetical protein [Steroidobacteraceae bacterium]
MTFDTVYESGSSLASIAGSYTATDGSTLSVDSNGVVFNQTAAGCVVNGQVNLIDASYDAYRNSCSLASCTGTTAALNGTTATGLGTLDANASTQVLYVAIHDQTGHHILAASYTKQ